MISLMICDDKKYTIDVLRECLLRFPDFSSIVTVGSGKDCIELIEQGKIPDVLLLDISMPNGMSGYEVAMHLGKKFPTIKIIAHSVLTDKIAAKGMIRCGVKGFVIKDGKMEELVSIIKKVFNGEEYYPPKFFFTPQEIEQIKLTSFPWAENITEKEKKAINLLATDLLRKQAADEMNISKSAFDKKINRVFKKTGTKTILGAVTFLKRVGILSNDINEQ